MKDTARLKIIEANEWAVAMSKYFKKVGLCAHFDILRATPAIQIKKLALDKIIEELKALDA